MKVKDFMTKNVTACNRQTNVPSAVVMTWEGDCGILPVVDENATAE
jgi:predicted transcriptional regulator